MYEDLVNGMLDSPGLVDAASGGLRSPSDYIIFWRSVFSFFIDFFTWVLELVPQFSSWVRDTPIVLAVIACLFSGFIIALFLRLYHSV